MEHLTGLLARIGHAIQELAEQLGAPGLALVAFFDSSFLSLPEIADALLVLAVIHLPAYWVLYAATTTAGSVAGCLSLYAVARHGGNRILRRRFDQGRIDRGLAIFRRYGMLAVVVPAILPPPAPFKIFVLLAGVARVPPPTFLTAVAIGRGVRYGGEAWLAYRYGERASAFIRDNLSTVSVWVAVVVAVLGAAVIVWRRSARRHVSHP